jgi:predicted dehydrogenase
MSIYVPAQKKAEGVENFQRAVGRGYIADEKLPLTRRDFMKGMAAGAAVLPITAAVYFGYEKLKGNPVRAGLIGCGDEGGILLTQHNPDFLRFVGVCDIRPTNQKRIFEGEPGTARVGFNRKGGYGATARKEIKQYDDYKKLLEDPNIEAVVIALPLHLHAQVSIDAMKAGKHVLCEKLMAWNVEQCKQMIKAADETGKILAIGHQRHYSLLYAHAVEVLKTGELGDIKHIRALWHRNNTWPRYDKDGKIMEDPKTKRAMYRDGWHMPIAQEDREALEDKLKQLDYKNMEELVRWRLFQRTGGGLMAELGSHQLDACSIFLNKVHPLAVSGVGTKSFYRDEYKDHEREVDDHVFVTFEFPGPNYYDVDAQGNRTVNIKDKDDVVVVTYSSINTNSFEPYGECVMGSRGTMIVEMEQNILLYPERDAAAPAKSTKMEVTQAGGGKAATDSSGTRPPDPEQKKGADSMAGPVSRGYTEEMEHFAYCIRMQQKEQTNEGRKKWQQTVKCHGRVAMADAIIALTSNLAMQQRKRIEFKHAWFEAASDSTPEKDVKA